MYNLRGPCFRPSLTAAEQASEDRQLQFELELLPERKRSKFCNSPIVKIFHEAFTEWKRKVVLDNVFLKS